MVYFREDYTVNGSLSINRVGACPVPRSRGLGADRVSDERKVRRQIERIFLASPLEASTS